MKSVLINRNHWGKKRFCRIFAVASLLFLAPVKNEFHCLPMIQSIYLFYKISIYVMLYMHNHMYVTIYESHNPLNTIYPSIYMQIKQSLYPSICNQFFYPLSINSTMFSCIGMIYNYRM